VLALLAQFNQDGIERGRAALALARRIGPRDPVVNEVKPFGPMTQGNPAIHKDSLQDELMQVGLHSCGTHGALLQEGETMFGTAKSSLCATGVKASARIPRGFPRIDYRKQGDCLLRGIKGLRERNTPQVVKRNEEEKGESRARKPRAKIGLEIRFSVSFGRRFPAA
jgi:hypothetical protein